ncbi:hypothetical protein IEQ34_012679 [Dendrobium chrysotoxum]|uniref:Uncharacterized protein n=1 Tax=Dendrobium chrysotoxum TaxID=161865 RepID=A0AAV7G686_DENCH|nr:hypothetical protein IEQ34_012679 [Dendrobium chrysotoxum]
MLINIARWLAEFLKLRVVLGVLKYVNCKLSINFKPLRSFPPLIDGNQWSHVGIIPASSMRAFVIENAHIAEVRSLQIFVDYAEVVERYAGLRKKNKPLVGEIEERVCKEAFFCITHAHSSPFCYL